MRNATCVDTQISMKWTYSLFPILWHGHDFNIIIIKGANKRRSNSSQNLDGRRSVVSCEGGEFCHLQNKKKFLRAPPSSERRPQVSAASVTQIM